jgi:NAD(P) transhydrogenase subunit alpha
VIGAGVAGLQAIATARRWEPWLLRMICGLPQKSKCKACGRFVELPIEAKDAEDARGYARRRTKLLQASA